MRAGGFTNTVAFGQGGISKSQVPGQFSAGFFADDILERRIQVLPAVLRDMHI